MLDYIINWVLLMEYANRKTKMIYKIRTSSLKKLRYCLVTRVRQQMPNGGLKPSDKKRSTLPIS